MCRRGRRRGPWPPSGPRSESGPRPATPAYRWRRWSSASTPSFGAGGRTSAMETRRTSSTPSTATSINGWRSWPAPSTGSGAGTGAPASPTGGPTASAFIASAERCALVGACLTVNGVGEPGAGEPHARFDRGPLVRMADSEKMGDEAQALRPRHHAATEPAAYLTGRPRQVRSIGGSRLRSKDIADAFGVTRPTLYQYLREAADIGGNETLGVGLSARGDQPDYRHRRAEARQHLRRRPARPLLHGDHGRPRPAPPRRHRPPPLRPPLPLGRGRRQGVPDRRHAGHAALG